MSNLSSIDDLTLAPDEIDLIWQNVNRSPTDSFSYWISLANFTFAFLGSISNLMSVIVLAKLSQQQSTFVYLTSLSLSDMITCLTVMVIQLLEFILQTRRTISLTILLRYVEFCLGALAAGSRVLSFWISLAVSMDRWILICYPIHGKRYCHNRRARIICQTLFFIAFLYSIPLIFEYEIVKTPGLHQMIYFDANQTLTFDQTQQNIHDNSFLITKGYSDLGKRRFFRWSYMFFNIIFVYSLPTLSIIIFNIQLIRALHRLKSRRKRLRQADTHSKRSHRRHHQPSKYSVTIMVIAMVLTLLICRSPTIVLWILWSFELTIKIFFHSSFTLLVRRFHSIANLIAIINAATNFIPFCVFGQLFRAQCFSIYCCHKLTSEQLAKRARQHHQENLSAMPNQSRISTFMTHSASTYNQQRLTNPQTTHLRTFPSFYSDSFTGFTPTPNQSSGDCQSTHILRLSDPPVTANDQKQQLLKRLSVPLKFYSNETSGL